MWIHVVWGIYGNENAERFEDSDSQPFFFLFLKKSEIRGNKQLLKYRKITCGS